MTPFETSLLAASALCAGIVNAVAGGGTFLTFPALVFTGIPPIAANATSAVAVFPGYLSGALGFLKELREIAPRRLAALLGLSLAGGVAGASMLLATPAPVFSFVIPWLLGGATLLFALGGNVADWAERNFKAEGPIGHLATFAACAYGGYFNGGLGIVLLALFSALGMRDLNQMNGLKNGMSFVLSGASVATFALAGIVWWPQAILMMASATLGGYLGATLARRLAASVIRAIVVCVGAAMTIAFATRGA